MAKSSHYPLYDVWDQHEEWDEHTRGIVAKRRTPAVASLFLQQDEALLLQTLATLLLEEYRLEVLTFIAQHIDESLHSAVGESERKVGVPDKKNLYRKGLAGLDEISMQEFQSPFIALTKEQQLAILADVAKGTAAQTEAWREVPQQEFFKKLLYDIVSAGYSHPLVWSEIGYGGPAYPRGYVRVEKGLVDPWEAKRDGE